MGLYLHAVPLVCSNAAVDEAVALLGVLGHDPFEAGHAQVDVSSQREAFQEQGGVHPPLRIQVQPEIVGTMAQHVRQQFAHPGSFHALLPLAPLRVTAFPLERCSMLLPRETKNSFREP